MIKLIHGADFHLDSPFSGLAPDQAAQRRREQRELLSRLARLAREREAGLVLLSGDLLDGRQTYRETAQALAQTLGEIPCPVLIAPGNHDPYTAKSLYAALDWPDNVHIFSAEAPQYVEFPALKCGSGGRRILRRFPISVGAAHWAARGFRALHMFLQPCRGDPRGRPSEPYRFSTNFPGLGRGGPWASHWGVCIPRKHPHPSGLRPDTFPL